MILIFTLLFNVFEAIYEGLYDSGYKLLSGILEFILNAIIILSLVYLLSHDLDVDKDFWSIIIAFALVRYFLFDAVYNLTRGLDIFFVGSTKLYDKILQRLGFMTVIVTKMIAGFLGIIFLL